MKSARAGFLQSDLTQILTTSRNELELLNSAKILICGGTGFLGTWLTTTLLEANEKFDLNLRVTLISRDLKKSRIKLRIENQDPVSIIEGDLTTKPSILNSLEGNFSHIIHAATPIVKQTGANDLDKMGKTTLLTSENLIQLASRMKEAPSLTHLSSGAVYGSQSTSDLRIPENSEISGRIPEKSYYGRIKLESEELVALADSKGLLRGSNPRLFTFFGPHLVMDEHFAIGNFLRNALKGEKIQVKGNPLTTRSYLYPTDMVSWLLAVIVSPTMKAIHIGSEIPLQMRELAEMVSNLVGLNGVEYLSESDVVSNYVPETKRMRSMYNVSQTVNLEDGLRRWVSWLQT